MDLNYKPQKVCISARDMLDIYSKGEHRSSCAAYKKDIVQIK